MSELTLIFPHQLFHPHPAIASGREILLLEDPLFFGRDVRWPLRLHRQKLVLHRASLTAFAERLRAEGHRVRYGRCPAGSGHSIDLWEEHVPAGVTSLHLAGLVDDLLERRLARFAAGRNLKLQMVPTPQFLSPAEFLAEQFPPKRKPYMARFYQAQRGRLGLLLEKDGSPLGGQWSFDAENRRRLGRGVQVPEPHWPKRSAVVHRAMAEIAEEFPDAPGGVEGFAYPVTHGEAETWLEDFLRCRFHAFGEYEDAISTRHRVLFHSVLTPSVVSHKRLELFFATFGRFERGAVHPGLICSKV